MRRRQRSAPGFGGEERLLRFVAAEWPPVVGECLGHWACREDGYAAPCVSRSGPCGWRFYTSDYARNADLVARHREQDARERWMQARMAWLQARGLPWADTWLEDWTGWRLGTPPRGATWGVRR